MIENNYFYDEEPRDFTQIVYTYPVYRLVDNKWNITVYRKDDGTEIGLGEEKKCLR